MPKAARCLGGEDGYLNKGFEQGSIDEKWISTLLFS